MGSLSFGHWTPSPQSQTQSAADTLLQSIDLAVEAERLGMDGAYFRVHHFARQLASPFPLLAAIGAKTREIEIGSADHLRRIVLGLTERGVHIVFVKENLTFTGEDSPMSNLLLSVMGGVCSSKRSLRVPIGNAPSQLGRASW